MPRLLQYVLQNDLKAAAAAIASEPTGLDEVDELGRTALMHAAIDGKFDFVELLLKQGADANASDQNGFTALHFAAQQYQVAVVTLLLRHGASVEVEDRDGNTPLARATFHSEGRGDVIVALLEAGADPDRSNHHGQTPIGLAKMISNYDILPFFGRTSEKDATRQEKTES